MPAGARFVAFTLLQMNLELGAAEFYIAYFPQRSDGDFFPAACIHIKQELYKSTVSY
jgi:hypothetical protein